MTEKPCPKDHNGEPCRRLYSRAESVLLSRHGPRYRWYCVLCERRFLIPTKGNNR